MLDYFKLSLNEVPYNFTHHILTDAVQSFCERLNLNMVRGEVACSPCWSLYYFHFRNRWPSLFLCSAASSLFQVIPQVLLQIRETNAGRTKKRPSVMHFSYFFFLTCEGSSSRNGSGSFVPVAGCIDCSLREQSDCPDPVWP